MASITQLAESVLGGERVVSQEAFEPPLSAAIQAAIAPNTAPACAVYPETQAQLSAIMTCASEHRWRVLPCGQGSKLGWGNLTTGADIVVSTQRLNRIVEHAVGDFTVTVEAGAAFAAVQAALRQTRQFIALDPAYLQQATLGGIVATRDTGALRQRYGGVRDMLIGISFVRHDGELVKAGGRVVKNVAGYDLMKLMTGSYGTLGILAQLTFRTYPLQEAVSTVILQGPAEAIGAATAAVRQSSLTPVAMDLLSPGLVPDNQGDYGLALQFQSVDAGVAEQIARLRAIATPLPISVQIIAGEAASLQFWHGLTASLFPADRAPTAVVAQFGILPTEMTALLNSLQATLAADSWQARVHAGSGIGTLRLSAEANDWHSVQTVRLRCQAAGGYLSLLEAPAEWKTALDSWALPKDTKRLMQRLQGQFDPQSCLSPGRL